jgi:hypothetical protein
MAYAQLNLRSQLKTTRVKELLNALAVDFSISSTKKSAGSDPLHGDALGALVAVAFS